MTIPKNVVSLMRNDFLKLHAKELEEEEEENKKISSNLKLIYDTSEKERLYVFLKINQEEEFNKIESF
jgi:hypothetical protein